MPQDRQRRCERRWMTFHMGSVDLALTFRDVGPVGRENFMRQTGKAVKGTPRKKEA